MTDKNSSKKMFIYINKFDYIDYRLIEDDDVIFADFDVIFLLQLSLLLLQMTSNIHLCVCAVIFLLLIIIILIIYIL